MDRQGVLKKRRWEIVKGEKKWSWTERRAVEKYLSRNGIWCMYKFERRPCDWNSESLLMIFNDADKG